jgi:hypothetical protein
MGNTSLFYGMIGAKKETIIHVIVSTEKGSSGTPGYCGWVRLDFEQESSLNLNYFIKKVRKKQGRDRGQNGEKEGISPLPFGQEP